MAGFRNCQAGKLRITQASLSTGNLKLQKNTTLRKYLAGLPCWEIQKYVFKELLLPTLWTGLTDLPRSLFPAQGGTGSEVNMRVSGISSHKLPTPTGRASVWPVNLAKQLTAAFTLRCAVDISLSVTRRGLQGRREGTIAGVKVQGKERNPLCLFHLALKKKKN